MVDATISSYYLNMRRFGKISTGWSPELAYAIGLLATDGSLSKDGRHIDFTSKDLEQVENLIKCLAVPNKIGTKKSGASNIAYRVQIGDVKFYKFLANLGLMPNKSKILGPLNIQKDYFFDFLRGFFDGDGSSYAYWDPRWKSSYMFYMCFASASKNHIEWLRSEIFMYASLKGHVSKSQKKGCYELRYAKTEATILAKKIYESKPSICLRRKYLKIMQSLSIIATHYQ